MKHARYEYDRIQDPMGKIPEDEPVFLIRGQDAVGPAAVRAWVLLAEAAGASPNITTMAKRHADLMEAWQEATGKAKVPDL